MKMGNFGSDITGNLGQKVEYKYLLSTLSKIAALVILMIIKFRFPKGKTIHQVID